MLLEILIPAIKSFRSGFIVIIVVIVIVVGGGLSFTSGSKNELFVHFHRNFVDLRAYCGDLNFFFFFVKYNERTLFTSFIYDFTGMWNFLRVTLMTWRQLFKHPR